MCAATPFTRPLLLLASTPATARRPRKWRDVPSVGCVRTATGVGQEHRAGRRRLALHELESPAHAVITEEALAAAENDGIDHQPQLVDEIARQELGRAL